MEGFKFVSEKSRRIDKLINTLYAKMPEIESQRGILITESYRATEDMPTVKRRSAAFAAQLVAHPRPASGDFTVADACRLWGVPVPEGMEYRGFTSISLQARQPLDRMLYFATGKEEKFAASLQLLGKMLVRLPQVWKKPSAPQKPRIPPTARDGISSPCPKAISEA